ncbi:hypothetical protein F5B19DRAFT_464676 [Rostrohypoxylon terebratum]|nr:hypothetical protein F5B19DRAFT_464676 [Rostrohypoxylon terebratum]
MYTGRHNPVDREEIAWAGNGVLTYYDPEFPYGLPPQRINNGQPAYYTDGRYEYPVVESPASAYAPNMTLRRSSHRRSLRRTRAFNEALAQVNQALLPESMELSDDSRTPGTPSSGTTLIPTPSRGSLRSESSEAESCFEEGQEEEEEERRERHVTFAESRFTRFYSPSPPPSSILSSGSTPLAPPPEERREARRERRRGCQGPADRREQEPGSSQPPQLEPVSPGARGERRRRPRRPRSQTESDTATDTLLSEVWRGLGIRSPSRSPSPPSPPRPITASRAPPNRRRSPTPLPTRRGRALTEPSPERHHRRRQTAPEPERGRSRTPRPVSVESGSESGSEEPKKPEQAPEPQQAPQPQQDSKPPEESQSQPKPELEPTTTKTKTQLPPSAEQKPKRPGILRMPTQPRVFIADQLSDRPARAASHRESPVLVRRTPRQNFARQLSVIDAQSGKPSRVPREESISSLAVEYHIEPANSHRRRRRRRHHHRERSERSDSRESRESREPEPQPQGKTQGKTSRFSFFSHLVRNTSMGCV